MPDATVILQALDSAANHYLVGVGGIKLICSGVKDCFKSLWPQEGLAGTIREAERLQEVELDRLRKEREQKETEEQLKREKQEDFGRQALEMTTNLDVDPAEQQAASDNHSAEQNDQTPGQQAANDNQPEPPVLPSEGKNEQRENEARIEFNDYHDQRGTEPQERKRLSEELEESIKEQRRLDEKRLEEQGKREELQRQFKQNSRAMVGEMQREPN
jgi:hypothetical protein